MSKCTKTAKEEIREELLKEAAKEELRKAKDETKHEPAPEKKPEAGECTLDTLVAANIRFAKAMKDAASEFYQLSCLAGEILNENQELRTRLGEK